MEGVLILKEKSELFRDNLYYKGIDGTWPHDCDSWEDFELWLMDKDKEFELNDDGLADFEYLTYLIEYCSLDVNNDMDLFIVSNSNIIKEYKNFTFLGFDYGVIECDGFGDGYYFSSILNEVRPDGNLRFMKFINELNKYYLFSTFELAQELHLARIDTFKENDDTGIETFVEPDQCQLIQVHLYKKKS